MSAKTTKCKNVNGLHLRATRCILGAARKIEPSCLMPFSNRQLLNLYTSLQILGLLMQYKFHWSAFTLLRIQLGPFNKRGESGSQSSRP